MRCVRVRCAATSAADNLDAAVRTFFRPHQLRTKKAPAATICFSSSGSVRNGRRAPPSSDSANASRSGSTSGTRRLAHAAMVGSPPSSIGGLTHSLSRSRPEPPTDPRVGSDRFERPQILCCYRFRLATVGRESPRTTEENGASLRWFWVLDGRYRIDTIRVMSTASSSKSVLYRTTVHYSTRYYSTVLYYLVVLKL